jgi:radical SAM protein with 4Fe4S-binding SPASM domain
LSITGTQTVPKNHAIRQAMKRRAGALLPGEVLLEVTNRCNLECFHCIFEPFKHRTRFDELSLSEWAGIMEQLYEIGVWYVTFSGGEPLCRTDIFQIMDQAAEQGLFFGLKTNGTLITEPVADRLKEMELTGVDISLYGATPKTHEYVTGVEGSYAKTIGAVRLLKERKIKVRINSSLMKCNVAEHKEMANLARQLGVFYNPDPIIFPKVGQPGSADHIRMDDEQLRTLICERNWIPSDDDIATDDLKSLRRHLICGAARHRCTISSQGEVFPCALWRVLLGDLRRQSFRDVWYGEAAAEIRAIEVHDIKVCANCELVGYCARCPGLVRMENGGISGPSSENCRLARAIKGVRDDSKKETLCEPHC